MPRPFCRTLEVVDEIVGLCANEAIKSILRQSRQVAQVANNRSTRSIFRDVQDIGFEDILAKSLSVGVLGHFKNVSFDMVDILGKELVDVVSVYGDAPIETKGPGNRV